MQPNETHCTDQAIGWSAQLRHEFQEQMFQVLPLSPMLNTLKGDADLDLRETWVVFLIHTRCGPSLVQQGETAGGCADFPELVQVGLLLLPELHRQLLQLDGQRPLHILLHLHIQCSQLKTPQEGAAFFSD